jgi:predicted O-methyltransferase YrrM
MYLPDKRKSEAPKSTYDLPCLTEEATNRLRLISAGKRVFEFGSGGSTKWFAQFADKVVSIEDHEGWFELVKRETKNVSNVDIRLFDSEQMYSAIKNTGKWDVVFVDCNPQRQRAESIIESIRHVKVGGWLVADDYTFPRVAAAIDGHVASREDFMVEIVSGVKMHPVKNRPVNTATAFCRRLRKHEK